MKITAPTPAPIPDLPDPVPAQRPGGHAWANSVVAENVLKGLTVGGAEGERQAKLKEEVEGKRIETMNEGTLIK